MMKIILNYNISIVNVDIEDWQVWQGDGYIKKTLARGFKTIGGAVAYVVDNNLAKIIND